MIQIFLRMENNNYSIITKLMGGLGNMMFQIAAGYSVAMRDGKYFYCDEIMDNTPHKHFSFYKEDLLRKIPFQKKTNIDDVYVEKEFSFVPIPNTTNNLEIRGYFQSEKYFNVYRKNILELFEPNKNTINKVNFFLEKFPNIKSCSIHVRRGDYVHLSDYHCLLDINYYKKATEIIGQDTNYLIFSDDINWCKDNFSFLKNKTFVSGFNDFEELYLMSLCDHNIIANSSFSWWGAWLNKNENKKVVAPKKWFGEKLKNHNTNDLYCEQWIKI